jgi:Domain of unknown function (DUF4386)
LRRGKEPDVVGASSFDRLVLDFGESAVNGGAVAGRTAYLSEDTRSRRVGGLSAVVLGISYIAITILYVVGGELPDDAAERLEHFADHTTTWWGILVLSVATDLLFVPFMWSLYTVLKGVNRNAMLAGTGLVGLFVLLDLAVTWPNYAALISLGDEYVAAIDGTHRTVLLGAATYAIKVLSSGLFGVYAILVPGAGIFIIGLVMRSGELGKTVAYLAMATGVLSLISVAGPLVVEAAGTVAILTSIFTTLWVLLVGYRLLRPAVRPSSAKDERTAA